MEDIYRQAFEQVGVGLVVVDPAGHLLKVNPRFCAMLGRSAEELIGKIFQDFTHPADRRDGDRVRTSMLDPDFDNVHRFEKRYVHADGSSIWASVTASLVRDADGQPLYFVTQVSDITQHRSLVNELREKTWLLDKAQEMSNVGHWRLDARTSEVIGSDQLFRIFGIGTDEANLQAFASVVHPEDLEYDLFHIQRGLNEGESWDIEHRLLCRDGTIKYVRAAGEATLNEDGSVEHLFGTVADVSDRFEAAERLRDSERRLRTILDSTADVLITIQRDGIIVDVNRAGRELFGYSAEDMLGQNIAMLVPPEVAPDHDGYLQGYSGRGRSVVIGRTRSLWAVDKVGTRIPITLRVTEAEYRGQQVFIGTIQDNREQERLKAQLLQAQKLESIGRLAGGVAHDFNNLLMVILGSAETALVLAQESAPLRDSIEDVIHAADKGANLTGQLLAFARKQVLQQEALVANDVVSGLEQVVHSLLGEGIALELILAPALPPILMDPGQFEQLLMNLAVNARDAIGDTGVFRIETCKVTLTEQPQGLMGCFTPGDQVSLVVSDDGCGMSPEILAKIFDPFFTTKDRGKGTGLGLATCYGIVMQNAGGAVVESQPGSGTRFSFFFPVVEVHDVVSIPPQPIEPVRGSESVLLVEDDDEVRKVTGRLLSRLGYRVTVAADGVEALAKLEDPLVAVDLLISDVVMPRMGGIDLARRLHERFPHLRVLFVSGHMEDPNDLLANSGPDTFFLQKPFREKQLSAKLSEILSEEHP